ncbi:MAG: hypothetical protein HY554_03005 [Elusimicrobia bacterium]|nr:hypothetical protein [Elusimicrobiota bacterium]
MPRPGPIVATLLALACAAAHAASWPPPGFRRGVAFWPRRLSIGACALGAPESCLAAIVRGLRLQDRARVRLAQGHVIVDPGHESPSANFRALQRIANEPVAATRLDFLAPSDALTIRSVSRFPSDGPEAVTFRMGHPDANDGFLGYTFFEFLGKVESGILYAPGPFNNPVVNSAQTPAALSVSVHHELRHVALGELGRRAALAKHGLPRVEAEIQAAESEAFANAAH